MEKEVGMCMIPGIYNIKSVGSAATRGIASKR
jgi:hypothetical protein